MPKDEKLIYKMTSNELLAYAQEMTARHDWQKEQNAELIQQNTQLIRQNNAMLMGAAIKVATELMVLAAQGKTNAIISGVAEPLTHTDCINVGLTFARECRDILAATPEALMENDPAPSLDPPADILVADATAGSQANQEE